MKDNKTSKLFIPYMSQFRATYQKARRSLKKRIDTKASTVNSNLQDQQVCDPVDDTETPAEEPLEENELAVDIQSEENELAIASSPKETSTLNEPTVRNSAKPGIGQYWEISNGNDSLNALIIEKDPYIVQFFDLTGRNDVYKLNDLKFEVLPEDFVRKLEERRLIPVGRSRVSHVF